MITMDDEIPSRVIIIILIVLSPLSETHSIKRTDTQLRCRRLSQMNDFSLSLSLASDDDENKGVCGLA